MNLTVCQLLWAGTSRVRRSSGGRIFLLLSTFHLDCSSTTRAPQYNYPSVMVQSGCGRLDAARSTIADIRVLRTIISTFGYAFASCFSLAFETSYALFELAVPCHGTR